MRLPLPRRSRPTNENPSSHHEAVATLLVDESGDVACTSDGSAPAVRMRIGSGPLAGQHAHFELIGTTQLTVEQCEQALASIDALCGGEGGSGASTDIAGLTPGSRYRVQVEMRHGAPAVNRVMQRLTVPGQAPTLHQSYVK